MKKFLQAFIAVRNLLNNPEDTEQVFKVTGNLRGKTAEKLYERLRLTEVGRETIAGQRNLAETLSNREELRKLPTGSLGRTYFDFTEEEQLTPDGLITASRKVMEAIQDERLRRVIARQIDSHDLWHVLTAYGREPLGEACLLAFTHVQTGNPGILFLLIMSLRKLSRGYGMGALKLLLRARKAGKRATWLPPIDWEAKLAEPLESIRQELDIEAPNAYKSHLTQFELATAS